MIIEELIQHFGKPKKCSDGYFVQCPCHDDSKNSLHITQNEKGIALYCHAGCQTKDIIKAVGLKMSDLFAEPLTPPPKAEIVAKYKYYDLTGQFVAEKYRYSDKHFNWKQPNNVWKKPDIPLLYNWQNAKKYDTVYFVEGEKDVDTLAALKLPAVSVPDGAKTNLKWLPEWTQFFSGRNVVIIPDNDDAGRALKDICVDNIFSAAKAIKVLDLKKIWSTIPAKADVTDYLNNGGTSEKLIDLVKRTSSLQNKKDFSEYKHTNAKDLQKASLPAVKVLVMDILPEGTSLLAAPSKIGKSWFVLDMGLSIAAGRSFLSHDTVKHNVLYLALEDSLNRLQSRMNKILAGDEAPENFHFWINAPRLDNGLIDVLTDFVKVYDIKLIIIDTLQKIRGAAVKNEGAYDKDYREMGELKQFADSNNISLFFVHHTRKMKDEDDSFNMISGTNGIMGAADTAYTLIKDKRDSENAVLHITGRDTPQISDVVHFDSDVWKWVRVGDLAEIQKLKHKQMHNGDPVVRTIVELVRANGSWKGQMSELLLEGERITGDDIADSARQLGSRVRKMIKELAFYNNISVDISKNGNAGKIYHFRRLINDMAECINGTINTTIDEEPPF